MVSLGQSVDDVKERSYEVFFVFALGFVMAVFGVNRAFGADARDLEILGMGHPHMDISCSPAVSRNFDLAQVEAERW